VRRRRHPPVSRRNPATESIDTNTIVLVGLGTALLGAIVYAVWQIGQTNDAISQAASAAQNVGGQIGEASQAGQDVSGSIDTAAATAQQLQSMPSVQLANRAAAWLQDF